LITKENKEKIIDELARDLSQADLIIVTDYRGMTVAGINNLRHQLSREQCRYRVAKNTLARLACRKVGLEALEEFLEGPTAIAYTAADPVGTAKIFLQFTKENEFLKIKGGILSGQLLQPEAVKALGDIPPREVLLAKVCGGFQAPIVGLVNVLQGNLRQLVYALDAVRRLKESA
jgi:large subunit ribosomal protein L10